MKESRGFIKYNKKLKKWIVRITFTEQGTGRRINRTKRCATRGEADRFLDEIRPKIRSGIAPVAAPSKTTMTEFIDRCVEEHFCEAEYFRGQKIKGVQNTVMPKVLAKHCKTYFGTKLVRDVDRKSLEAFRKWLIELPTETTNEQRSITTVNHNLNFLRTCFRYGVRQGIIENNVFSSLSKLILPNPDSARNRIFTFGEEMALFQHAVAPREHLRLLFLLAADTGMRRGEILGLKSSDISWEKNTIFLKAEVTKTKRARTIHMTERVRTALWDETKGQADGRKIFSMGRFQVAWETAQRLAGVENAHFHDWRHTFLTRCVAVNVPLPVIVKQTGHASEEWQRHLNPEHINAMFTPLPGQSAEEVKAYARAVLTGLRAALGFDKINNLLGD